MKETPHKRKRTSRNARTDAACVARHSLGSRCECVQLNGKPSSRLSRGRECTSRAYVEECGEEQENS